MFSGQVILRALIPAATVVAEAKGTPKEQENTGNTCRPSELPIYTPDPPTSGVQEISNDQTPAVIENSIRSVRQTIEKYTDELKAYEKVAKQSISESKQNVEWLVDYLRQEDNTLPKAGAIAIGALTGLIFGLRGGFLKRTIYATTGGLGMAAVCYPKEASEYTQIGVAEGKKFATIAYNFAYGDDKQQDTEATVEPVSVSKQELKQSPVVLINDPLSLTPEPQTLSMQSAPEIPVEENGGNESLVPDSEQKK